MHNCWNLIAEFKEEPMNLAMVDDHFRYVDHSVKTVVASRGR